MTAIYAHRCAPKSYPENTIESAIEAFEDGANGFECDVMLTRDCEPVIIHPNRYNNFRLPTVNTDRPLSELTWSDLRQLTVHGTLYKVPHLDDVLSLVAKRGMRCFIEPKTESRLLVQKTVARIAQDQGVMANCTIISFAIRRCLLRWVKETAPEITTNAIQINPFAGIEDVARACSADEITLGWKYLNHLRALHLLGFFEIDDLVRKARSKGIVVMALFADAEKDIRWLKSVGVEGIFTNNVLLAKQVVG